MNRMKPQGRKIQKIDPEDLAKIITIYDSMMYLIRSPENKDFKKSCLEKAIKNNTIYKGYRWNFVEKDDDPNISTAKPTHIIKKAENQKYEMVLQLNNTKTKIIDSAPTKKYFLEKFKISSNTLSRAIKNNKKIEDSYIVNYSDCPEKLLKTYKGTTTRKVNTANKLGPIKRIDPISKNEVIFDTFDEINVKLGFKRPTIKKAIENKTLHGGSLWIYC